MSELQDIIKSIKGLYKNFSKERKFQFLLVTILNILSGYCEFITVASVGIFITSLTNPEVLLGSEIVNYINKFFLIKDLSSLKLFILIAFIFIVLISSITRLFNLWFNVRFKVAYLKDLSKRAFEKVLKQEYEYFLNKSSSELISDLTINMDKTDIFISYILSIFTYTISLISIVLAIFFVNFKVSFSILLTIGLIYIFITYLVNNKISRYGNIIISANNNSVKALQEAYGSIKEIILDNNNLFYPNKFSYSYGLSRKYENLVNLLSQSPKFAIEGIGLMIIAYSGYILSLNSGGLVSIEILGTVALGVQKLLPVIQNIFASWTNLVSSNKGCERIIFLLDLSFRNIKEDNIKSKKFSKNIIFKNVSYKYPTSIRNSVENLNLTISKGEKIGLIGKTGSGKSTFINILMGFLPPTSGEVLIDNKNLHLSNKKESLLGWRNSIGHVPQKIFLSDSTIIENIAFLQKKENINLKKVEKSAKIACIYKYIKSSKNNFQTMVGENGISLSGGQLQRIGIARALYKDSEVLILDEGTSALDKETSNKIMDNLNKLSNEITVIMITHELSTLKNCDRIFEFENGSIKSIYSSDKFNLDK